MWEFLYDANGHLILNFIGDIDISYEDTPTTAQRSRVLFDEPYVYDEPLSFEQERCQKLRSFLQMSEEEFEKWLK